MRRTLPGLLALTLLLLPASAATAEYLPVILHNTCKYKVQIFIRHLPPPGTWVNSGWWFVQPNQMTTIRFENEPVIHDSSQPLYYYAVIPKTNYRWNDPRGRVTTKFNGATYALKRNETADAGPDTGITVRLHCNNFKG